METSEIKSNVGELAKEYGDSWKGRRIAIVEDVDIEQDLLQAMLGSLSDNLEFNFYKNGQRFIDDIKEGRKFDLVIIDGELLGNVSGPDTVSRVRRSLGEAKIIGRTGKRSYCGEFEENGADLAIFKDPKTFWVDFRKIAAIFEKNTY